MKKLTVLLSTMLILSFVLSSCKKDESVKKDIPDDKTSGDIDVIRVLENTGFVSSNPEFNVLYGGGAVNDFFIQIDETAVEGDITELALVINGGDTISFDNIDEPLSEITDDKYTKHFTIQIDGVEDAENAPVDIIALDENKEILAKVSLKLNIIAAKPNSIQLLHYSNVDFYYYDNFFESQFPEAVYLDVDDNIVTIGKNYGIGIRGYHNEADLENVKIRTYYLDADNNEISLGSGQSVDTYASPSFADILSLNTSEAHFIDHDNDDATPRIATYHVKCVDLDQNPIMEDFIEITVTEAQ